MFSRFEAEGMMNLQTAMAYRRAVLDPGGTVDAVDMVRAFLKREPRFDALEQYLREGVN
jgi:thimet oligopeptidase